MGLAEGITYGIVIVVLAMATFVSAILSLVLKDDARSKTTSVLLAVSFALMLAGHFCSQRLQEKTKGSSMQSGFEKSEEMNLSFIAGEHRAESKFPLIATCNTLLGTPDLVGQTKKACEKSLRGRLKDDPDNQVVSVQVALLAIDSGEEPCPYLMKVPSVSALKDSPKANSSSNKSHAALSRGRNALRLRPLMQRILCDKEPLGEGEAFGAEFAIKKAFSAGWCRNMSLLALYKKSGDQKQYEVTRLNQERELDSYANNMLAMIILRLVTSIGGVLTIAMTLFSWSKIKQSLPQFDSPQDSFKSIFAVPVASTYMQVIPGMILGFVSMVAFRVNLSNQASIGLMYAITGFISCITTIFAIYLLILRPKRQVSLKYLNLVFPKERARTIVLAGIQGFFGAILLEGIASLLMAMVMHTGTNNQWVSATIQCFATATLPSWVALTLTTSFFVPIAEELTFRGLIHPWLKRRFGVPVAVVGTGLLFAAYHLDPGQFVQLSIMGITLSLVYERSGSLISPMITHSLINLNFMIYMFLLTQH